MQSKLTSHFDFNFNAYVRVDQIKNARQTSTLAVHNWNPNVKIALSSMKLQTPKNCIWPVWFTKSISLVTPTNRPGIDLKQNKIMETQGCLENSASDRDVYQEWSKLQ